MEHDVKDTTLLVSLCRKRDSSIKYRIPVPCMTRKIQPSSGHNGKCEVIRVSLEEMERLWK